MDIITKNIDKILHFAIGYIISDIVFSLSLRLFQDVSVSIALSLAAILLLSIVKEYIDSKNPNNKFDNYDILAAIIGFVLLYLVRFYI